MSVVDVKVPISGTDKEIAGWIYNVSQHIDVGNSVRFVDEQSGNPVSVSRILINSAGSVCIYGVGFDISTSKKLTLAETGFHTVPGIGGIRADDTTTGIGIHVKI
jgi:hypothetical protein